MILLSGHSLTHARRVPLEALSLSLKERESTATMVPASMDGIGVSSWFQDDTEPGRGIVWRVKSIGEAYATNTPTIQLEHVINTLRDRIMFGEITAATITGNSKATTCTAEQAVRYILSYQSDWVLGSFGYSVSNPYKFDGDTLFDALETVTASLSNACWTYDMSAYPFRLNIVNKDSTVGSELRAGRNLKTITKTIDKSSMYTRFYPIGKDDLHIAGNYVERNANVYGVIEKVETDASIDSESELRRWANERLDVHAEPNVTIDVEGYELANATGESLDRMVLGRACRVPLPEYGTTIQERIVTLTYQDKVHQPDVFKATLANNREDITKIIADNMKSGGKGGRTSTKQSKEDHAWFEDTNDHVAMCAIGIIGTDAQGNPNWTRLSRLEVNENGIYGEVKSVQGELVIAETRIDMNEYAINLEAKRAQTAEGDLSGRLTVQADKIEAEVTRAKTAEGTLSGRITVEAGKITQIVTAVGADGKVTAASIIASVNGGASTIQLNADHIDINGLVNKLKSYDISAESLSAHQISSDGECTFDTVVVDSLQVNGNTNVLVDAEVSGNTLTITYDDGTEVTFSKATTLTGAWSSGTFTVTASPQGNSQETALKSVAAADITWNGDTGTFNIYAYNNGSEVPVDTGKTMSVTAPVPHAITAFDTNAPAGETYNNLTNNADGYVLSGSTAYIVVKSTWKCDGNDKSADSYLQAAPTKLYAKGKSDADSAYSAYNSGSNSTLYYYDTSSLSYKVATGSAKRWYYK